MKLILNRFAGMFSRIAKEKAPIFFLRELVNYRISNNEGLLNSRKGAKSLISSGITALENMTEFTDKGGNRQIVLLDGASLKESAYSGGYGAVSAISNDERESGSTVSEFFPVVSRKELRSGAGVSASTDSPFWVGYIPERKRFNENTTINAGRYYENLDPVSDSVVLEQLIKGGQSNGINNYVAGTGFETNKKFAVYVAPVFDGQRGRTSLLQEVDFDNEPISESQGTLSVTAIVLDAHLEIGKRITALDFFVAELGSEDVDDNSNTPAYFLEQVDLNADGDFFLERSGNVGVTVSNKIVIDDYAEWLTFNPNAHWIYDATNDDYYQITGRAFDSPASGQIELTVSPNAPSNGSATLKFFSRWTDYSTFWAFDLFYDNNIKKLGSNMYDYLGFPRGDNGVEDLRFKYMAIAGRRSLIVSFPDEDSTTGYFSKAGEIDVYPVLNKVLFEDDPTGVIDIKDDSFLVFYERSTDLISVFANQQYKREDNFRNIGAVSQEAIDKINDDMVAVFDQTGPYLVGIHNVENLGDPLGDWWESGLSESEKDGCVVGFDRLGEQIFFSFPDYNSAPFTTGIVFVYDLRARRLGKESPWYILYTNQKITSVALASDSHLLSASAAVIRDWNNATPDETFSAWILLKMLENPEFNKRVNIKSVMANFSGSNSLDIYKDESSSPDITRSLTSRQRALVHTVADNSELKFTHSSAENGVIFRSAIIDISYLRT